MAVFSNRPTTCATTTSTRSLPDCLAPTVRITRMRSDIAHTAMTVDFVLQASADQSELSNLRIAGQVDQRDLPDLSKLRSRRAPAPLRNRWPSATEANNPSGGDHRPASMGAAFTPRKWPSLLDACAAQLASWRSNFVAAANVRSLTRALHLPFDKKGERYERSVCDCVCVGGGGRRHLRQFAAHA